jgi:hypothetical protein
MSSATMAGSVSDAGRAARQSWQAKARKHFFFEKKKQKTFYIEESCARPCLRSKSFLVLFFKKEHSC